MLDKVLTEIVRLYTCTELKIMAFCSVFGAWFSIAVGGMDSQVIGLISLVIIDYATGLWAGWNNHEIGSKRGTKGIFKKVSIFIAIAFAHTVDMAMGINSVKAMAMFGFAGVEATSIIENVDRAGYGKYIPNFIREKLIQIRTEKTGGKLQ